MIKRLLLIGALLVPTSAMSHDWDYIGWLERTVHNDQALGRCYLHLINNDVDTYTDECDIHAMAMTHADSLAEFYASKENHPGMTDVEFITEHFDPLFVPHVNRNFKLMYRVDNAIMTLYLAEHIYIRNK